MGEANYYLIAIFPNRKKAKEIFGRFEKLLDEHQKAHDEWQEIREHSKKSAVERYGYLKKKYHLAFETIKSRPEENDPCMNFLAGDFFDGEDKELRLVGNEIWLRAYTWHGSSWNGLCEWLIMKGGKANWLSDEYLDIEDYMNLIRLNAEGKAELLARKLKR